MIEYSYNLKERIMEKSNLSNHEITKNNTKALFLEYDQDKMIEKFSLKHDAEYIYITFLGQKYRIDRTSGNVELLSEDGSALREAGFSETLSIFDVLCYSKDDCRLAGSYCAVYSLKGIAYTGGPGKGMFDKYGAMIDKNKNILTDFCERIGGEKTSGGDISYKIDIFDFMPAIIRFWESDDEFPAELKFYWDENILMYMHFETVFYVMGHIGSLLTEFSRKYTDELE